MTRARACTVLLLVLALGLLAVPVLAHSFLVRTEPEQGGRLSGPPRSVAFQFTEPVVLDTVSVMLTRGRGEPTALQHATAESGGRVVRLPLPVVDGGVFVVSWEVTSAVDAHGSSGEFAFAVGEDGRIPDLGSPRAVADGGWPLRGLFILGLAGGAGGLIASRSGQRATAVRATWGRGGLALAMAAAAAVYVQTVLSDGLTPAGVAVGITAMLMAVAVPLSGRTRSGLPESALTLLAVVAWAARSHPAALRGVVGVLSDAAHLVGASLWLGMLAILVVDLWRVRSAPEAILASARRYSAWALWAVGVLAAAGLASALMVLTDPSDLWETSYGRVLTVKMVLVLAAVALAAIARTKALPAGARPLLRATTGVEMGLLLGVVAATLVLTSVPPPAAAQAQAATLLGPPPMTGPTVRDADLAGMMTVGAVAGEGRLDLMVYAGSDGGIDDAEIQVTASLPDGTNADLHPRPCGAGCFTQRLDLPPGTTTITVRAKSDFWQGGSAHLKLAWPPSQPQPHRLDDVIDVMRRVDQLTLTEKVSSGPGMVTSTTTTMSGDELMDLEVYSAGDLQHVTPLPDGNGLRLYLPGSRILIDLHLDEKDRIARERIVSPGHEIERRLQYP